MSIARLASLYRYPVKGFGAETLHAADLARGRGVPFDRCLALANGKHAVASGGAWTPCQAFVRLTRNPDLPGFDLHFDEVTRRATLRGPDGRTATLAPVGSAGAPGDGAAAETAEDILGTWFAAGPLGTPRSVPRAGGAGYWDHEDAALSIVNLETVALLERAAGRPLDPLRFRANLHLAGLPPLAELALPGRRLRVGEAELEVLRPADRCRATSVDPAGGGTDLNVPALLARTLGHVYCGVYARVVQAGRIAPGDEVQDLGSAPGAVRQGAGVATAPPVADWPRAARLTERVVESAGVVSFWLDDSLASLRPAPRAGQHLRVHLLDEGRAEWRAYTISGAEGPRLRLSVKRDGPVSGRLHDAVPVGAELLISGPHGEGYHRDGEGEARPLVLLTGGIGITPTVAMLRELAAVGDGRPVRVAHVARDGTDLALWAEVRGLVDRLPDAEARLYLSRGNEAACAAHGARPGRMPFDAVLRELPGVEEADVYACGPAGFLADARAALARAGVAPERIHVEAFASPKAAPSGTRPDCERPQVAGPFRVRFASSGVEATWTERAGTLLDLAEAAGLTPPANCRSGACGACRRAVRHGAVAHRPEPALPVAPGTALLCCAVPLGDLVLA